MVSVAGEEQKMKISIVGLAGSGKTTLAKRLMQKYGIEHLNLDYVIYKPIPGTHKRTRQSYEEYTGIVNKFIVKDNWIVEGLFPFRQVLEKADKIVWIKPHLATILFRQWKRYFTDPIQRKEHGLINNFRLSKDMFMLYFGKKGRYLTENLKLETVKEITELLKPYLNKLEIIKSSDELKD